MSLSVLLVDDDDATRMLARHLLKSAGFQKIAEARDGSEALTVASGTNPDLILLDLQMPGMDGWTALPRLREKHPASRIVVVSGMQPDPNKLVDLGANGFISKDCRNEEFLAHVQKFTQRASQPFVS